MTASFVASDFLARLRRPLAVSGVLFLTLTAGICGDDDDDDGTGPSATCVEEINYSGLPFDEGDVEALEVGDNESGSLTENDVDDEGYYADIYILGVDSDGDVTLVANPTGFDLVLLLFDDSFDFVTGADSEDPAATEELTEDLAEGCYMVVVTSFEAGETGSYSLSVD